MDRENDASIDGTVLLHTEVLSMLCMLFISRNFPVSKAISLSYINFGVKVNLFATIDFTQ